MKKEYQAASNFLYQGAIKNISPMGEGHINKTYLVTTSKRKYTLQLINTGIFTDPEGLMDNIYNVTEFLRKKILLKKGNPDKETLTVIKTTDNNLYHVDDKGGYWRSYKYIDDVVTYQQPKDIETVKNAGYAFGDFLNLLSDYDMSKLKETIKDFHNTPVRYQHFRQAVKNDTASRVDLVIDEIEFVEERQSELSTIVNKLLSDKIPLRVTHNDTKLNNLLFDSVSNKPVCIVDLDTVMPGSLLYDYGDALRIIGSSANEDEHDLNKVYFKYDNFEQFSKGFLFAVKDSINNEELGLLPFSIKLITLEIGMRFLTDYLKNDIYFQIHRENHNLIRARTQFKLVGDIENNIDKMNITIEKIWRELS